MESFGILKILASIAEIAAKSGSGSASFVVVKLFCNICA